jgi:hypothetical protein
MQLGMAQRKNEGAFARGELTTVPPVTGLDLEAVATGIPAKFKGKTV